MSGDRKEIVRRGYDRLSYEYRGDDTPDDYEQYGDWVRELSAMLPEGASALDIGCGCGLPATRMLAGRFSVTGVDISEVQINRARELVPEAEFVRGDIMDMDFPWGSFDAVVSFYAIIHMPLEDHRPLIGLIHRWLRPGGLFMATVGHTAWTGEEEAYLGVEGGRMVWSHADEATYVRWMTETGFDVLHTGFVPEGDSGHSLVLARKRPAPVDPRPMADGPVDRLSQGEVEVITLALESGRRWCRRGRAGYSIEYTPEGFRIAEQDEEREAEFVIRGREEFMEWLLGLDVTIRGYSNSWSFLRMDFGMESLDEWTARKDGSGEG